jgi:hypothetical protein
MFQSEVVEKIKTRLSRRIFFSKVLPRMRKSEKYCTAGKTTDDIVAHAHCMLDTKGYTYTLTICNPYLVYTATKVARTRLNVTLYEYCLSCLI